MGATKEKKERKKGEKEKKKEEHSVFGSLHDSDNIYRALIDS
jgi:hypothetical protein